MTKPGHTSGQSTSAQVTRQRLLAKPLPSGTSAAQTGAFGTDWDLAATRIQLLAGALVVLWIFEMAVGFLLYKLTPEYFTDLASFGPPNMFWSVLPALLVLTTFRIPTLPLPARLVIGISFVLSVVVLIAAGEVSLQWWAEGERLDGLPWVSSWLLVVPMVVPIPWWRSIGRTVLLSAVPPFVLFAGIEWFGLPDAPVVAYLDYFVPCLSASVLGSIIARMMYRLTKQVREAERLGSYFLEERIGSGGMGEVWRARHHMLIRPAAIKLVRPEKLKSAAGETDRSVVERFQLEAQATASLRSPHTVELYDFGVSDEGTFFYVMELLDGLDLDVLVQRYGPQPPGRVVHLLGQVCDSLADAHANGLLHRDIKPANIYTCRAGQRLDFVKVLDFGLVRWTQVDRESLALTNDQVILGTPAFMAPEAAAGEAIDHRFDLYSLGCVAYWLLTGHLVFEKDTPLAMAVAHVQEEPIPPSARSELEIPPALDDIVLSCLAKRPDDRPQSAAELASRLAACELGEAWSEDSARRWWQAHLPAPTTPAEGESGAA